MSGMNNLALPYAEKAIALANATPDAGYPAIAEEARLLAMVNTGQTAAAQAELKKVLARPDVRANHGQVAELNSTAAKLARIQNDIPGAIAYMNEALNEAFLIDAKKVIPRFQSDLSDLYKAERKPA